MAATIKMMPIKRTKTQFHHQMILIPMIIKHLKMDQVKTQRRMLEPLKNKSRESLIDSSPRILLVKMNLSNSKWLRPKVNKSKALLKNGVQTIIQGKLIPAANLRFVSQSLLEPNLNKKKASEAQLIIKLKTSLSLRVLNITQSKLRSQQILTLMRKNKNKITLSKPKSMKKMKITETLPET